MSNKFWFGCPKYFLAFYSKGEYDHHNESEHRGGGFLGADMVESKG